MTVQENILTLIVLANSICIVYLIFRVGPPK